jgi:hypothetical protein
MIKNNVYASENGMGAAIKAAVSLDELRANDSAIAKAVVTVIVGSVVSDWFWSSTSTAADDDSTVVKVTSIATGRWIKSEIAGVTPIAAATQNQVNVGESDNTFVSPVTLAGRTATTTRAGLIELATTVEATTGTNNATAITPKTLNDVLIQPKTAFRVSLTANWAIPNVDDSAENNVIPFNQVANDTADALNELDLATGIFTATYEGYYLFNANIPIVLVGTTDTTSDKSLVQILKGGGSIAVSNSNSVNSNHSFSTGVIWLSAGQTISVVVTDTATVGTEAKEVFGNCTFSGIRVA